MRGSGYPALVLAVLSLALGLARVSAQEAGAAAIRPDTTAKSLAFEGTTVVDVDGGRLLHDHTVVITGRRVQTVGPRAKVRIPKGARVIDARGKYLIPGLWEMHAHTEFPASAVVTIDGSPYPVHYPKYLVTGVTGIREMAQRFRGGADSFRLWQREIMAGTRLGPRMIGPSADLTYKIKLDTPEDAHRIIDSLKAAGDAFVKFHDERMAPDLYFAVLREARDAGLPLVGHVPLKVPNAEAADSGHKGVEHISKHYQCVRRPDKPAIPDSLLARECRTVAQAYIRNGTWLTPTIMIDYYLYFTNAKPQVFRDYQAYLGTLYRLGVRNFLTGTDCGGWLASRRVKQRCHHGLSVLQEIVFLAESGFSPLDALRAATVNPAKHLGATDSLGTIAPGKLADLVLLDGDPLTDVGNILKTRAVVANGYYFDRAALDAIDPKAAELTQGFVESYLKPARPARRKIPAESARVPDSREHRTGMASA
jgi:hypothetical protein